MKFIKLFAVIALLTTSTIGFAQKLGHVNSNEILSIMPEKIQAEKDFQMYTSQLEEQLQKMSKELQAKYADYQANQTNMSEPIKKAKENEIRDMESRIQEFRAGAEEDLAKKENELLEPIITKVKTAIEEVAKEGSYTYIFDSSAGILLYAKDSEDIMSQVKKKLGLI
jgi:outer membrane protein